MNDVIIVAFVAFLFVLGKIPVTGLYWNMFNIKGGTPTGSFEVSSCYLLTKKEKKGYWSGETDKAVEWEGHRVT